jgi:hypothetical protein
MFYCMYAVVEVTFQSVGTYRVLVSFLVLVLIVIVPILQQTEV